MRALAGLCGKTSQMGAQQAVLQHTGGFARLPDAAGQARAKADRNFHNFISLFHWHLTGTYRSIVPCSSRSPLLPFFPLRAPPLGTYQISTNHPRLSTPAPHGPIAVAQRAAPAADYFPPPRALRLFASHLPLRHSQRTVHSICSLSPNKTDVICAVRAFVSSAVRFL